MLLFDHHAARLNVRVVDDLVDGIDRRAGQFGLFEQFQPFGDGLFAKDVVQDVGQLLDIGGTLAVVFETRILDQFRTFEDVAKLFPKPVIAGADDDVTVLGGE